MMAFKFYFNNTIKLMTAKSYTESDLDSLLKAKLKAEVQLAELKQQYTEDVDELNERITQLEVELKLSKESKPTQATNYKGRY